MEKRIRQIVREELGFWEEEQMKSMQRSIENALRDAKENPIDFLQIRPFKKKDSGGDFRKQRNYNKIKG